MLVLNRKKHQEILLYVPGLHPIRLVYLGQRPQHPAYATIGIDAPQCVNIARAELEYTALEDDDMGILRGLTL